MLDQLFARYDIFLQQFPLLWHGPISLILALAIAGLIWHVLRQSGLWLILLLFLVPALIPVLRGVAVGIIEILKFLLSRASL